MVELLSARVELRGTPGLAVLSDVFFGAPPDPFMLMRPTGLLICVATQPVDSERARPAWRSWKEALGHDPMKGAAVAFRAKRTDRVKIVVWDGSGLAMYWKRLDGSGFKWPPIVTGRNWTSMHAPRIPQPKALA